ncbi:MAG: hypothetical protein JXP34_08605 [Planctomycetes bacterium]|nr:hypothetical protein [Planctomycetota bacterium]
MMGRDPRAARDRRRRRERETSRVVRSLARVHGLGWRQRRLLAEIAAHYGLPGTAPLYFRPSLLEDYANVLAGARRLSRRLAVQEVFGILFENAGPPRPQDGTRSFTPAVPRR